MTEDERKANNARKMLELYPAMRSRISAVISQMERSGERPRIAQAFRTSQEQSIAQATGHSWVKKSFHEFKNPDNSPAALAADIIDDNNPLNSSVAYMIKLACCAADNHCRTGILWGLSGEEYLLLSQAIKTKDFTSHLSFHGKDGTHVEPGDISLYDAVHLNRKPI